MKISQIIAVLEQWAPPFLQESYDNCGLLTGHPDTEVGSALLSLDVTEAVLDEAIAAGHKLIIAHHPIIFKGLKRLTGKSYVERTVIKAIKNDIAIYAMHTNADNVHNGVNAEIAKRLGLVGCRVLSPKSGLLKMLRVNVPLPDADRLAKGLFEAGAGSIGNYDQCSFALQGNGTFRPGELANPHTGERGKLETVSEILLEVVFESWKIHKVLAAMRNNHPYEEIAHQIVPIDNALQTVGSGMIGNLPEEMTPMDFLRMLKEKMNAKCVRHTKLSAESIRTVALCGGSGNFLLEEAIRAGADVFVSADFTYHRFFDADSNIIIADIGHYETEQFTPVLIMDFLNKKMPTFAPQLSKVDTNPINYF